MYVESLDWSMAHRWVDRDGLPRDSRLDIHRQQVHRPRLDAAGRSERTRCLARTAGRLVDRSNRRSSRSKSAQKLEKIPGVRAVIPQSSNTLHRARDHVADHAPAWTIRRQARRDRRDGAEGSRSHHATTRIARPRITFPNALGGRDTFAPIRAMLLGPDMVPLVEYGEGGQRAR